MADEKKEGKKKETNDERKESYANYILSLGDKELRELAESIASFLSRFEFLQSEAVERGWGIFTAWMEQQKKKISNPYVKAGVEKGSDILDKVASALFRKKGKLDKKSEKKVQDWMGKFLESVVKRLQDCESPEKVEELSRKLESEYAAFLKIINLVEDEEKRRGGENKDGSEKPKNSFISDEIKKGVKKTVEEIRDKHAERLEKRIKTLKERKW